MKISARCFFFAFTAAFAVLAAYVFWGTWSPDVAPVMPDDMVWHPLAFSDQFAEWFRRWLRSGVFVPMNVFFDPVCFSQYWMQELKYVAALYVSSLGLAYFLRGRGLSPLASYGAGLLLGFCGYWSTLFSAGHAGFFMMASSMVFALAFFDHAIASCRRTHWMLAGVTAGWGCCHQPDIFLLFVVLIVAYGVYACVRERRFPWKGGLVALAFFAIVGAPGVRMAFTDALTGRAKQIEESKGSALAGGKGVVEDGATAEEKAKADAEARWIFVTNWSMPPEDTLEFFIPRIHGDTSCPMTLQLGRAAGKDVKPYTGRLGRPLNAPQGNYRQHSLYVGWVTCLLALVALAGGVMAVVRRGTGDASGDVRQKTKDVVFFAAAAILFWLFSMGRFCEPVYRMVYLLPFGDYLRAPVKWHHVTELCLCALAGFGIETLFAFLKAKGLAVRTAFVTVAAIVLAGAADLARIERLFCAPIDLRIVTGRNAVADEIARRGKGKVCDLVEGGRGLLSWSFNAHGIGVTSEPDAKGTRFVLVGNEQLRRTPQLAQFLKARATAVWCYALTRDGIRAAAPQASNVSLYQMNGVPPPAEPESPPVDPVPVALGILSLVGTSFALLVLGRMTVRTLC